MLAIKSLGCEIHRSWQIWWQSISIVLQPVISSYIGVYLLDHRSITDASLTSEVLYLPIGTSCIFTNIAALATHPRKDNDCNGKILLFLVCVIIQLGVTSAGMDRSAQKFSHCLVMGRAVCFALCRANAWGPLSPAGESSSDLCLASPQSKTTVLVHQQLEYCIIYDVKLSLYTLKFSQFKHF